MLNRIKNRGPNCTKTLQLVDEGFSIFFCASVLWMQGPELFPQPVEYDEGVFLYNGDIFDDTWDDNVSDTQVIAEKLCHNGQQSENHILQQLKSLKGPFSIIYYDKVNKNLYFTRDKIGRSSLLFYGNNDSIIISNVLGRDYDCVEIPATHIQILNLTTKTIKTCPWDDKLHFTEEVSSEIWLQQLKEKQNLPDDEFKFDYTEVDLNDGDGVINHIESTANEIKCKLSLMEIILEHKIIKQTVLILTELLYKSVQLRLRKQPNKCQKCLVIETDRCNHCTAGILFSGGLDCTILAVLADKCLPKEQSIDLINVAFKKENDTSYDVPDRLTGRQSLKELQNLCRERNWNFKEINVSTEELKKYQEIIGDLVYPRQTILDDNLGTALWFASRGKDDTGTSTSRILLVGSGADELFGGYIRHRNAYKRRGWQGLNKELELDWKRISFRNLARDNRVICDHGRQPRMPYLDEDFTNYVLQLKPWLRCFPSEEMTIGIGDKLMLRLVAFNLGLVEAVILPKRALQFGSRIANKKQKGRDRKSVV